MLNLGYGVDQFDIWLADGGQSMASDGVHHRLQFLYGGQLNLGLLLPHHHQLLRLPRPGPGRRLAYVGKWPVLVLLMLSVIKPPISSTCRPNQPS